MPSTGFVELSFGDITLARRFLAIARRWSDAHTIVVWVRGIEQRWVDVLLDEGATETGGATPTLRILVANQEETALREAGRAAFCILSSPDLMLRLEGHQVCVFWPPIAFPFGSLELPPEVAGEPARPRATLLAQST